MNKTIDHIIETLMPFAPMDAIGVGVIDFKNNSFEVTQKHPFESDEVYFDLASLTKPLTNSLSYFLKPESFTSEMLLCLSHRGGLPSWGLLPHVGWKEIILSYPVKESETLYSDFSALRVHLELEKQNIDQKKICETVWDKETLYWTELSALAQTPQYGYKNGRANYGEVHDPNAWVIGSFCSHAGLFSTIRGVCQTLLNFQTKTDFISIVTADLKKQPHRFSYGWDRVVDPSNTLAGTGCSTSTFGHLGFTGTSIWIDPEKMRGHVILTNAVKHHWFDKTILNDIRRMIGSEVWKF